MLSNVNVRTFCPAHETRSVRPLSITFPSCTHFPASSLIAKVTYPTPFEILVSLSSTTNAVLMGAISEKSVCRSMEVAVYGRLDTNTVDLPGSMKYDLSLEANSPVLGQTHV
jgi:hypothetical protein